MLKKTLIFTLLIAAAVCPFLPKAHADDKAWQSPVADRVWDHDAYRIQRLALDTNTDGPLKQNGTVFLTHTAAACTDLNACDRVDLTLVRDGKTKIVPGVDAQIMKPTLFAGQSGQFVYFTKSTDKSKWLTASMYDPAIKDVRDITTLDRKANELNFMTFATTADRMYASVLQSDKQTQKVESSLIAKDLNGPYEGRELAFTLSAPWQEIVDVQGDWMLVKFQFSGGNKQLWLINARTQVMKVIPNTWTEPQADILYGHFLSDGSVAFFQNFRMYTFDLAKDQTPQAHGEAKLSWVVSSEEAVQVSGPRIAWIDSANTLFTVDAKGVTRFGSVKNGAFHLGTNFISYANDKGYQMYNFDTKSWSSHVFEVTDIVDTVMIGVDKNQNVWYENQTNGALLNIGFGINPMLSDRTHAYWKGTDDSVYQASFSPIADLPKPTVQAFRSDSSPTVYLVSNNKMWRVTSESTYFTWFDSWNKVARVSDATLAAYRGMNVDGGDAGYAPGTRVKAVDNSRVYMVGTDGNLHWIVSESVASSIYGAVWNKGIIEVNSTDLWRYANGKNVDTEQSVKSI